MSIRKAIACCAGILAVLTILSSQNEPTPWSTSPDRSLGLGVARKVISGDSLRGTVGKTVAAQAQNQVLGGLLQVTESVGIEAIQSAEEYAEPGHSTGRLTVVALKILILSLGVFIVAIVFMSTYRPFLAFLSSLAGFLRW